MASSKSQWEDLISSLFLPECAKYLNLAFYRQKNFLWKNKGQSFKNEIINIDENAPWASSWCGRTEEIPWVGLLRGFPRRAAWNRRFPPSTRGSTCPEARDSICPSAGTCSGSRRSAPRTDLCPDSWGPAAIYLPPLLCTCNHKYSHFNIFILPRFKITNLDFTQNHYDSSNEIFLLHLYYDATESLVISPVHSVVTKSYLRCRSFFFQVFYR